MMLARVHQPLRHSAALAVLADRLEELDVQLQEELANCGVLTVRLDQDAEVWIGVDQRMRPPLSKTSLKVLVVIEPPEVNQLCMDGFDVVLTWQAEHLESLPNAHLFVPATPWLIAAEWPRYHGAAKRCELGFLRGSKRRTRGHQLRHEVWEARGEISSKMQIATDFLEGGVSREERNRQFACQFVLVIENSRHPNYFTEKLLDAMLAQCVPVYWGCENLRDFFDVDGVISIQGGVEEVVAACQGLAEADYTARALSVKHNFELAKRYAGDFGQRVQGAIKSALRPRNGGGGPDVERVE
mmetsp:Transcript_87959/g.262299  ORF Transcript_87959/g.262299 Transcript_87959/m.262299 type:complete len:299 (+) Transcript_87959:128-1024(+)